MGKKKQTVRAWAVIFWLIVWQAASMALSAAYTHGSLLLASPIDAAKCLFQLVQTADFWLSVANSATRILGGFAISLALALILASLSSRFSLVEQLLAPLVAAVKAVPVASFIILALVWLTGRSLSLFISALMVFPPIYLNMLEGIRRTDVKLIEMARVYRVPFARRLAGIYVPQVLPYFRSAVSTALGLCWKAGTAAEVIGLCDGTIGERLYTAKVYFQTPELFAWTAVIVLISAGFEKLFLLLVDRLSERIGA